MLDKLIEDLIEAKDGACTYPEETLFVTEQAVCKSGAGYYVGTWCIEVLNGSWLPQPYSRDSGYSSKEDAEKLLASWKEK